jgi:hypothetical protein
MDALNLPICDIIPMTDDIAVHQLIFTIHEDLKVYKLITDNVDADCWAVTSTILNTGLDVDPTEVLFNNFEEETLSLKEIIMNNIIRKEIIKSPYNSLLIQLFRFKRTANIDIYMFKKTPYKIRINYNWDNEVFTIYGYMSESYKVKYCNE